MRSCTLIAPAKVNLYLEIIGDRLDGYHELVMILQSIDLADRLEICAYGAQDFNLTCSHPQVPTDETNLAYCAAQLMKLEFNEAFANYGGVDITIDKHIPVAAGLAGGSTDAAAVLVGLNLIWELGLTIPELQRLGEKLGSDVPFCIAGGTVVATGKGEKLDPIEACENLWIVLGKYQSLAVSTSWAYQTYRQQFGHKYVSDRAAVTSRISKVHSGPLVKSISHKDNPKIGHFLHNDLEKVVLPKYCQVMKLRKTLQQIGGLGTMMSGSGPTIFTLCQSQEEAENIKNKARQAIFDPDLELLITKLSSTGIKVI
ncbi:4-(cytidine 5'-diphospho)-2-C-methyl-D-erythritol kinase [Cyanobacterium sp. uoEpiScrs1]|uniref:4-(cytidine 5'-diphospho)-2-C-methyl-D-erythritol kinase n=1 Tax=Cyanobacterium sp. uoEpiScrs1 TaxID=2976343 RepID=UPI00226A8281|nr:4-(cytidine 5'-diphospho)-2-C-methyl-D-erythritol kinase [Cyanobacterium sp. uoEpiScrs1]